MPPLRPKTPIVAARPAAAVRPAMRTASPAAAKPAPRAAATVTRAAAPRVAARPAARIGASRGAPTFAYEDDPDDVVAAHASASTGSFDTYTNSAYPVYKAREGENCIRIMHRTFDYKALGVDPHWAFPIHVHYGIGPDEASYLCPNKMLGQPCCLCDERRALSDDLEALKALRPGKRFLTWIIDRMNEAIGPQLWAMPQKVEKDICIRSKVKRTGEALKISNPNTGYDITFNKEGSGINTQYLGLEISRDPSPLHEDPDIGGKWISFINDHPLDTALNWYEQDYIAQVYSGQVERPSELDPGDTAPRGRLRDAVEAEQTQVDAGAIDFPDPDAIMSMEEDELATLCAENELSFDIADFDNDLEVARQSIMEHFYGATDGVVEPDPLEAPLDDELPFEEPVTRAAPSRANGVKKPASSPVAAAKSRLQQMAPRGTTARR